ncbi:hypothetical protein [Bradyrhizobium sp. LA7.1]|uniref:hypothetical protein n=1 Tax=Bradyrhizobium sp. LA7.1 TaxID=3156324 RepID=UPI0033934802
MPVPRIVIVGADKGGVGKTMLSRALLDYFADRGLSCRAFDTEAPTGNLHRFYPDASAIVDLTKSDNQMRVLDGLRAAQVTLIDIRAGLLSPTLTMLRELDFFDGIVEGRLAITVVHVIGSTQASFAEIAATTEIIAGAQHVLAVNHINEASFSGLPVVGDEVDCLIEIGKLNELAADHVDAAGVSFRDFIANESNSGVMRGYVRAWLRRAFKEFDQAGLVA